MKFVVDKYEVWKQGVLVDADFEDEAIEKVENGEGDCIESWFGLSSRESLPVVANAVPFDPEKHELPVDHPYRKYLKQRMLRDFREKNGIDTVEMKLAAMDHDDLLGMPGKVSKDE